MGKSTGIEWTDSTVNFWQGCHKVSQGCKFCYMFSGKARWGHDANVVVRSASDTFNQALRWHDSKRIFTCSWSDFFIEEADPWRDDAWDVIRRTPQHQWQILTKRPERIASCLPSDWGTGWANVWLGVSTEDQAAADRRIPHLLGIPAAVHFLSCEPLLAPLDLRRWLAGGELDWVIVGGESGSVVRRMDLDWVRALVTDCQDAAVPIFVKQLGTVLAREFRCSDTKGGDPAEWPEWCRVRQFPAVPQHIVDAPVVITQGALFAAAV